MQYSAIMKNRLINEFYNLKVKHLLDKRLWDIPIIEENESIEYILKLFGRRHHIWVLKNQKTKEIAGVITEHDILSIIVPKKFSAYGVGMPDIRSLQYGTVKTAKDLMSTKLISCKPDDTIKNVLQKMVRYQIRRLPVVEEKKLVGELTLHQLIQRYYEATQYYSLVENKKEG